MAAVVAAADMTILKNTQILVTVEEALADILVVSYIREDKQFQGVLLDSTKRNLPFGVSALHPAFFPQQKGADGGDDRLHSASQRFAYRDGEREVRPIGRAKAGQRKGKMTVRLRPRKVLCSKCEGICNENSENVARTDGRTRPRKEPDAESGKTDPGGGNAAVRGPAGRTLIPKLSRLRPSEITRALNGGESWSRRNAERDGRRQDAEEPIDSLTAGGDSDAESESRSIGPSELRPVGAAKRKRRANVGEETAGGLFAGARTLKISYGEGEETVTVLRLPTAPDGSGTESVDADGVRSSKAARKALKKAKKLARKPPSPCADRAPQRRHKRKAKHKKRRKGDRDGRSDSDSLSLEGENGNGIERVEERDQGNGGKNWESAVADGSATSESASESSLEAGRETDRAEGDENNLEEGDVVWGKLRGHPWWPGRVVSLHQKENEKERLWCHGMHLRLPLIFLCGDLHLFLHHSKSDMTRKRKDRTRTQSSKRRMKRRAGRLSIRWLLFQTAIFRLNAIRRHPFNGTVRQVRQTPDKLQTLLTLALNSQIHMKHLNFIVILENI